MEFRLRVAPSGELIEGTAANDVLLFDPVSGKWSTGPVPGGSSLGQLRFLVGSAGSGANFQDLDAAIAAAVAQAVLSGERQTVYLVAGETFTAGANPLQLPSSVDLVGLPGPRPALDVALELSPAADVQQSVQHLDVQGSYTLFGVLTCNVGIPDVPLTSVLELVDVTNTPQLPGGATDSGIAIDDLHGQLTLRQGIITGETGADGGIVLNSDNDPSGQIVIDRVETRTRGVSAGALRVVGAGTVTTRINAETTQLLAITIASGALRIDPAVTLNEEWNFEGCLAFSASSGNGVFDLQNTFTADARITWEGGRVFGELTCQPGISSRTTVRNAVVGPGPVSNGPLMSNANFGGDNQFDNCAIVRTRLNGGASIDELRIRRCQLSLSFESTIESACDIDDCDVDAAASLGANPIFGLGATGTLTFTRNRVSADPSATLIAEGLAGATVREANNVVLVGNAAWTTPAASFGGGLTLDTRAVV